MTSPDGSTRRERFGKRLTQKRLTGSPAWSPAPPRKSCAAISTGARVYLLIVNTREECVIGGERTEIDELLRGLGKSFIPLPAVSIAHCEIVRAVANEYRRLHLLPINPPPSIRYYSGGWGHAYDLTSDSAANAILAHATNTIDFPRLIERAYADGFRIFVEVGPGNSCSRMISRILDERPHFARSICIPRSEPIAHLQAVLAELFAEGVDVDLSALFPDRRELGFATTRMIRVPVGGKPIVIPLPPTPALESVRIVPDSPKQNGATASPIPASIESSSPILDAFVASQQAIREAQSEFLEFNQRGTQLLEKLMRFSTQLAATAWPSQTEFDAPTIIETRPVLDTDQCREFAIGSIAKVLGPEFAPVDSFPTRVRLPDGPLMLVDHVLEIDGEARSMVSGRVVTDHLVHNQRWYIAEGHIPTSICVEAGQADLFLSGYLGIDFVTRGLAVYRLLDAVVTFHRALAASRRDHSLRHSHRSLFPPGPNAFIPIPV